MLRPSIYLLLAILGFVFLGGLDARGDWAPLGTYLNVSNTCIAETPNLAFNNIAGTNYLSIAWREYTPAITVYGNYSKYWNGTAWVPMGGLMNFDSMNNADEPCLAYYPGNGTAFNPYAVWSEGSPSQAYLKTFNGTSWSWVQSLNNSAANNTGAPRVVSNFSGSYEYIAAVWQESVGSNNRIYLKQWDSWDNTWANSTVRRDGNYLDNLNYVPAQDAVDPVLGIDLYYQGVYIAWREKSTDNKYYVHPEYCAMGYSNSCYLNDYFPMGVTLNAIGTSAQSLSLAVDCGNPIYTDEPIIVWSEIASGGEQYVRAVRLDYSQATYSLMPLGGAINDSTYAAFDPSVCLDGGHQIYVAWVEKAALASAKHIKVKVFDGAAWVPVGSMINNDPLQDAEHPVLSRAPNGDIAIAWSETLNGGYKQVYVKTIAPFVLPTHTPTPTWVPTPAPNTLTPTATPTPTLPGTLVPTMTATPDIKNALNTVEIAAFPNPATTRVNFAYNSTYTGEVTVRVYNTHFRLVKELKDSTASGVGSVAWDVSDISPGIYFYQMVIGSHKFTSGKLVIAR